MADYNVENILAKIKPIDIDSAQANVSILNSDEDRKGGVGAILLKRTS